MRPRTLVAVATMWGEIDADLLSEWLRVDAHTAVFVLVMFFARVDRGAEAEAEVDTESDGDRRRLRVFDDVSMGLCVIVSSRGVGVRVGGILSSPQSKGTSHAAEPTAT